MPNVRYLSALLVALAFLLTGCESALVRDYNRFERIGDLSGAHARLDAVLAQDPANAEAHFLSGKVFLEEQKYPEARKAFDIANDLTPRYAERIDFLLESRYRRHMKEGVQAFTAHQFEDAVFALAYAVAVYPDAAEAYRMLGHSSAQNGELEKAGAAYENGLLQDSLDLEALRSFGEVAYELQEYEKSIKLLTSAHRLDLYDLQTMRRLAHAHAANRSFPEAERILREIITEGGMQEDRAHLSFILFNQQKYDAALPYLQQVASTKRDDADIYRALAETLFEVGKYGEAVQANNHLLELVPGDRFAMSNLVKNYEKLGDVAMAKSFKDRLSRQGGDTND